MKKRFLLACCFLVAFPLHADTLQDGLLRRIRTRLTQTQARQARLPQNQWKQFLLRQRTTPALIRLRNRQIAFVQTTLKNSKKLEQLVPVGRQTAFLLRLERGLESFPPEADAAQKTDLLQQAAQSKQYVHKQLLGRYNRLQKCINQHPQLAGYTLNPDPEVLFSRTKFYNSYGTVTAYQTAQKMFCTLRFGESIPSRRAQAQQKENSFVLSFPSAWDEKTHLEAVFNETTHFIFLREVPAR